MSVHYFTSQNKITITNPDLETLWQQAQRAPLRRARYCLHRDWQDPVHEMVIAFCRDTCVPPHRHRDKSESFHVIRGRLLVVFFDDQGRVSEHLQMKPPGLDGCFLYRLNSSQWHTVLPLEEPTLIHEVTAGPFDPVQKDLPSWAPDDRDPAAAHAFQQKLREHFPQYFQEKI